MYYGARYYHHILGRFTQPDPSIFSLNTQTLANPQLLNPYTYSLNNPLRYTDPDGKNPAETVGGWGVGIAEGLGNTAIWLFQKTTHPIRSTQEAGNMVSKAGDEVFSILQNPGIAVREAGQGYGIQAKELGEWYWNASDYERGKVLGHITEKVAEGYVVGRVGVNISKNSSFSKLFNNRTPKASELVDFAESQGWTRTQTSTGPIKYIDESGLERMTIKQGSPRTLGSESPHVSLRDAKGQRIDHSGNPVSRKDPANHTPIQWDIN